MDHVERMRRKKAVIDERIAAATTTRGVFLLFTGNGKGKSTAAFGLLARALGHGLRAVVVQFVKSRRGREGTQDNVGVQAGASVFSRSLPEQPQSRSTGPIPAPRGPSSNGSGRSTGEEAFFRAQPNLRWHVKGAGFTWETQDAEKDAAAAQDAWAVARLALADPEVDLVILDEFTYAFKYRWLELDEVLAAIRARPVMQHLVVTGRAAPQALIDAADTVTEMRPVKHAFQAGIPAMPGIEF